MRNWTDFDTVLRQIALIDLAVAEAESVRSAAIIDAETEYQEATAGNLARRKHLAEELEEFYREHRKEVEDAGKRSMELTFGRAGIRKGNPTLALRKGWKWPAVIDAVKAKFRDWERFVSVKESAKKDALKDAKLADDELAEIGLKIRQGEEFFFETFPEKAREAA